MSNREEDLRQTEELITIIMPCYNAQLFVGEAIQSVINQTWPNWELLVIDDGSKDKTGEIASQFAQQDSRVRVIYNEKNMGVSITRNRGIDMAQGKWIAFLDADDLWEPDKLQKQLDLSAECKNSFIYTGYNHIDESGNRYGFTFTVPERASFETLSKWSYISTSGVLLQKDFLGTMRFERNDLREDYYLWLRLLKKTDYACGIDDALHSVRHVSGSRSSDKKKMLMQTYKVHRLVGRLPFMAMVNTLSHFSKAFILKYRHFRRENHLL
ncbi:MAG: glycosyltransferase family 2 protein [Chloroflexi bacterium]|nr:glycosyltransferase family 2 protein [Chloroflexota bacterium]